MIDPNDYFVNNPLITPINKALLYDNAIWNAKMDEQERIIKLLEQLAKSTFPGDVWHINPFEYAVELLIKGETE